MTKAICSIKTCTEPARTRGWCGAHYERWRRTGDVQADKPVRPLGTVQAYFLAHVMEPSDGCRDWPFGTNNWGYGQVRVSGESQRRVHVVVCELWHGQRPEGMEAAHSCGRPICWAGEHLRWATRAENAADMVLHGTAPRGERNGFAKLTADEVREIRRLVAAGETQAVVAARFEVRQATVSLIARRETWRHLD